MCQLHGLPADFADCPLLVFAMYDACCHTSAQKDRLLQGSDHSADDALDLAGLIESNMMISPPANAIGRHSKA